MQDSAKVSLRIWGQSQAFATGSRRLSPPQMQPRMQEKLQGPHGHDAEGRRGFQAQGRIHAELPPAPPLPALVGLLLLLQLSVPERTDLGEEGVL